MRLRNGNGFFVSQQMIFWDGRTSRVPRVPVCGVAPSGVILGLIRQLRGLASDDIAKGTVSKPSGLSYASRSSNISFATAPKPSDDEASPLQKKCHGQVYDVKVWYLRVIRGFNVQHNLLVQRFQQ